MNDMDEDDFDEIDDLDESDDLAPPPKKRGRKSYEFDDADEGGFDEEGFFDEDGKAFDEEQGPIPPICMMCSKNGEGGEQNAFCKSMREDQVDEDEFICGDYEPVE
ncbi:MAG TPA: hypothetical protein VHO70_06630 [Chitinispirillaceae bacterium]|nr:hypothetical protein [Chitinispirillaceae bacterium]